MSDSVYEQLAEDLNRLPNGFPRTPSSVELRILKKIFSSGEASIASQLSGSMESVATIAKRTGLSAAEAEAELTNMAKRGLLWYSKKEGKPFFRLAPFVVGIYEAQVESMDHELAHLVEEYLANGGAAGIMKPQPALHRVIPAQKAVKTEWILPYDDVKAVLLNSRTFRLADCICRKQQDQIGHKCDFPMRTCLQFSQYESPSNPYSVSKEEALAFLDKAEEMVWFTRLAT